MKRMNHLLLAGGMAVMLCMSAGEAMAQNNQGGGGGGRNQGGRGPGGPGNWDPAQFAQRMMERYKESLEITDEAEWSAIQPLVQKVQDARMAIGFGGRGMFGRGPRGGGNNQGDQNQRPAPNFGPPNPEADMLQKAVDAKASTAEVKAALTKYVASRKVKQADLEKAQADLRKVLTPRQEAIATLMGLL
jgi:hypothetical protein